MQNLRTTFKASTLRNACSSSTPSTCEVFSSSVGSANMFKSKSTPSSEKARKSNVSGSNEMIRLQLPNSSSSNSTSTEPLTPPTTPLQPQTQNQVHSNNAYRLASSQASNTGHHHSSHFTASSNTDVTQHVLQSSNSPSEVPLSEQSMDEPLRSAKLGHFQE